MCCFISWLVMHTLCSKGFKTIFLLSIPHTAMFLIVLAKWMLSKGAESSSSHWCQFFPFGTKDVTNNLDLPRWPTAVRGSCLEAAVQSNAITSSSSSVCSVRDLFALIFSFSSNFLLRLLSSAIVWPWASQSLYVSFLFWKTDNNVIFFIGLLWWLNELLYAKCSEQFLAHCKCYIYVVVVVVLLLLLLPPLPVLGYAPSPFLLEK